MKKRIASACVLFLFSLLCLTGYAQNTGGKKKITGTVVDVSEIPMAGVNVIEKGTRNGVVLDFDGQYSLSVNPGATIVFSFVGMKTKEVVVGNQSVIDVVLEEDIETLSEIVIVGYGAQKRENLTGAIETIKPDDIQDLPVSNLAQALVGQIAGLSVTGNGTRRPGETADLTIRQTFSFSKDGNFSTPLVVIDDMVQVDPTTGMPTLDTFNRLDPSEIESMTVLKDASAAIYGSRASQGAIIVKTKRGKKGKIKFSYSSQFATTDAVSHSKTMNAYESGIYNNRMQVAFGQDPVTNAKKFYSATELEEMKGLDYDWLDEAWHSAEQQRHSFTVSGGNDSATYFGGITYFTQGANLGNQDFNKWNFRTGVNTKISENLDASFSVSGNTGEIEKSFTKSSSGLRNGFAGASTNSEQADYGLLLHMPNFVPITTTVDGEEYYMSPFHRTDRNLGGNQSTNSSVAGWNYFATLNSGSKQMNSDFSLNVNASLNYKLPFLKGVSLKASFARNQTSSDSEQVALPFTLARIKNFTAVDHHLASAAEDSDYSIKDNTKQSRVSYDNRGSKSVQANFFANYKGTFGDHDVDAMVGVERSESEYNFTRLFFENPSKDYLGTYTTAGTLTTNSYNTKGESGTLSYLGRVNYSYKSKYLFQFIFRSDASTKFAPENYWGTFPSVQLGWIMSKEDWFDNILPSVDYLKVRYSIGKTGKDNIKPWRWATYYDLDSDKGAQFGSNGGVLGGSISTRVNPNREVGWDSTIKNNAGIDFSLFKNRLSGSIDYYYDSTTDALTVKDAVDVPISIGGGFAEENFSDFDAWGTEFSLNWKDQIKEDFSYNVGVIVSFADNKVKKIKDAALTHPSENALKVGQSTFFDSWGFKTWNGTSTGDGILRTDEDVNNYWNYLTERATAVGGTPSFLGITDVSGLRKGMLAYQDIGGLFNSETGIQEAADGQINKTEDYAKLNKTTKRYGFTTNLGAKYKGLFMKTQIATSWGGYKSIDNMPQYTGTTDAYWSRESFWTDMYSELDNVNGKYPSLAHKDQLNAPSDFWSVNTFRCSVRNLTVGFSFPKEILSPLKISNASLSVTGNNLWDFYNPFPDHYRNMYDNSLTGYPTLRTWTANLNISF